MNFKDTLIRIHNEFLYAILKRHEKFKITIKKILTIKCYENKGTLTITIVRTNKMFTKDVRKSFEKVYLDVTSLNFTHIFYFEIRLSNKFLGCTAILAAAQPLNTVIVVLLLWPF